MNKIDSQAQIHKKVELHKKKIKQLDKGNRQQIELIKKSHVDRLANLDSENAKSVISTRKEGDEALLNQISVNEKRLEQVQKNLAKTEAALKNQEFVTKEQHKSKMSDFDEIAKKQSIKRQQETNEFVNEINRKSDKSQKKIQAESQRATFDLRNNAANALTDLTLENQRLIDTKTMVFEKQRQQKDLEYRSKLEQQEIQNAKNTLAENSKHNRDLLKLQKSHKMVIENETIKSKKKIEDTKKALAFQLNKMKTDYLTAINTQKELGDLTLNKMKEQNSKAKTLLASRQQDSFYKQTSLNPQVKNLIDHYEVSIKVPEHEKDQVNLDVFKRKLKLSLARRFQDKYFGPNGGEQRTTRSEVLSKVMQVPDIMNPKNVTTSYKEGILTFYVEKA